MNSRQSRGKAIEVDKSIPKHRLMNHLHSCLRDLMKQAHRLLPPLSKDQGRKKSQTRSGAGVPHQDDNTFRAGRAQKRNPRLEFWEKHRIATGNKNNNGKLQMAQ